MPWAFLLTVVGALPYATELLFFEEKPKSRKQMNESIHIIEYFEE